MSNSGANGFSVVYFGSGAFGLPTLERLATQHQLLAVVTQPDRPAGRGGRTTPTPIAAWAAEHAPDVPVFKPERVNVPEVRDQVRAIGADAWVVIAFGQLLGQKLLTDKFAVNLHASLLPRWRGAAPIHAAVLAGDVETGNSVITLAQQMDAGAVLGQSHRPIERTQTTGELHDLLAGDGPDLVEQVLREHAAGTLVYAEQDEAAVTLAPKLSREDALLDLSLGADACRRQINGLSPWPGVSGELDGVRLKLLRADHDESGVTTGPDGTLIDPDAGMFAAGGGVLRLLEVQPAGKKPMAWADFARGRRPEAGAVLGPAGVKA